jgi:hypothetical protein
MMSLTEPQRQALGAIADGLAGSDPRLASMLNIFTRLAAGEEMPAREKTRAGPAAGPDPLIPPPAGPVAPSGERLPRSDIPPGRHLRVTPNAGGNPYRSSKSLATRAGPSAIGPPGWVADRGDEKQCSGSVSTGRTSGASAPGRRSCRPTRGTPMWSGPRRSPVPVTAPAEEQPGSHLPPGPPRRRADRPPIDHQVKGPVQCTRTCCNRSPASARRTFAGQYGNTARLGPAATAW